MDRPVILYGPPAVGKDTITAAITQRHPSYRQFRILKAGAGKTSTYRMTTARRLSECDLVAIWTRYGNTYAIDADGLNEALRNYRPILHFGAIAQIRDVLAHDGGIRWLVVDLNYPRAIARERLAQRNSHDIEQRLAIFDDTPLLPVDLADLRIDTSDFTAEQAADSILGHAQHR
jgi:guanylate kinase